MATGDIEIKKILEEFEISLTCENLKENKDLVKMMDDYLSIHMSDYLANQIIAKYNFDKEKLIEAIKYSEKYFYESQNNLIKLKYRPKRKLIVFRDIPKEFQKKEEILELFDLHNCSEKIIKIEDLNGLFFVYFRDEETTLEIYKWIEKMKEDQKELPFYFTAFVKVENLKKEWLNMEHDDEEDFSGIISNPKEHKPRKLSAGDIERDLMELGLKIKHSFSKFDKYDCFLNAQKNSSNHIGFNHKNKFDFEENSHYQGKRSKANSINYQKNYVIKRDSIYVPLNKDYPLTDEKIEHKYQTDEITKIFINMNFLKKFEMPEDLKNNFVPDLFNENAKSQLDQFRANIQGRYRSNTAHNISSIKKKFNHLENKHFNSYHHNLSKFAHADHLDEYDDLRHGQKHSLWI